MPLTLERRKPKNRAPLLTNFKGESKEKNQEGFMHTSPTKSQRERSLNRHKKIAKKRLRKSPKRENGRYTIKP
jgi:hypothetical protein